MRSGRWKPSATEVSTLDQWSRAAHALCVLRNASRWASRRPRDNADYLNMPGVAGMTGSATVLRRRPWATLRAPTPIVAASWSGLYPRPMARRGGAGLGWSDRVPRPPITRYLE